MNLNDVMRWAFAQCCWYWLPVCDNGVSCLHGCTQLCLILWILIRKNTMAARPSFLSCVSLFVWDMSKWQNSRSGGFNSNRSKSEVFPLIYIKGQDTVIYYHQHEHRGWIIFLSDLRRLIRQPKALQKTSTLKKVFFWITFFSISTV